MENVATHEPVGEAKRPWEPITVTVYNVRDSEFAGGTVPDGTMVGSNPS